MPLDPEKLKTLKQKMIHGKNFKDTFNYFFDLFEDEQFDEASEKVEHPELATMLEGVAQQLVQKSRAKINNLLILSVGKYNFYHGPFAIEDKMASFIFLSDVNLGIISIASLGSPNVLFARFSLLKMKNIPSSPSLN